MIDNRASSATFEIELPRAAPRVEIQVGEARVFLKEGARVTTTGSADAAGTYRVPLQRSGA